MNLSNLSVAFRTAVLVLVVLLTFGGLASYLTIPKEANPEIEIPIIIVSTIFPGASPTDVEGLITQPIEQEMQGITGIDEIRSTSTEGASILVMEFLPGTDTNEAFQRVRDRVDQARPDLPSNVEEPVVNEVDLSEFPIMTINLAGAYSITRLQRVAEDLEDALEVVNGVLEVDVIGGIEREVQVNVDLNALQAYGLSFNTLTQAIQRENVNVPGGSIDIDRQNYLIRVDGEISDPDQLNAFVVAAPNGVPVYLRDVADVKFGVEDRSSYARLRLIQEAGIGDGDPAASTTAEDNRADGLQVISLEIKQRTGSNILETAAGVRAALDEFVFPSGTEWVVTSDQSEDVEELVSDLENNIISGLLFVVLVLLFFLGVRNASLVAIAIPLSMFMSVLVLQAMGITLNFIVLFTLIIALGILVDNAIVIVENIYRLREDGMGRLEAARQGASEFAGAITVATLTTCLTFAPLLFWPGLTGEFMSFLPLTLIIALLSSLFVAVFVSPALMAIFGRTPDEEPAPISRAGWYIIYGALALGVLVLGFANWQTVLVLALAVPIAYLFFRYAFAPVSNLFMQRLMPRLLAYHRMVLTWVLDRDYTGSRAIVRNTAALGAFTGGLLLLLLGGLTTLVSTTAALILLVPGGLAVAVGLLGILVHSVECLVRGGWWAVWSGLALGAIMALLLGLISVFGEGLAVQTFLLLMALPLVITGVGLAGALIGHFRLLTDNRALLLNATLGGGLALALLFALAPTGVEFFPDTDPNQVRINMEAPLGTNIDASNRLAARADAHLLELLDDDPLVQQNVENMLTNVGVTGSGDFAAGQPLPERSRITLNLVDYGDRVEASATTLAKVREAIMGVLPDVTLDVQQDELGPPTGPPVNIEITGPDYDEIVRLANEAQSILNQASEAGQIQGLVDLRDNLELGRPELRVAIDRERASSYGLSTAQIGQTVRAAIAGTEASTYRVGDDDYDVTVRLAPEQRSNLETLETLNIVQPQTGEQIPLASVADFIETSGLGSITRLNLQRVAVIEGRNAPGFTGQEVLQQVQEELTEFRTGLPPGYALAYTGEQQDQDEAFGFLVFALLAGIMLIFLVTVAKFNSLSAPLIVLLAVGLSQIGVIFTLLVSQTPFGLMVFVGIISLFGILVNNNIVLLDYIQQLRRQGYSNSQSIIVGGVNRLRPVLLTALTTILALIPLTFGIQIDFVGLLTSLEPDFQLGSQNTQFWGPMGTSIIGGLLFALFITLLVVPTIFSVFESLGARFSALFGLQGPEEETHPGDGAAHAEGEVSAGFEGNGASRNPSTSQPTEPSGTDGTDDSSA